jgi:excinuclease ABC subunit C
MRGPKKKGVRYFGPYAHAWAIRETLDLLLRVFPARTCSAGVFKRAGQVGRPCLLGYIGKCSAPCVGRVDADEHRRIVEDFCDFMAGQTSTFLRRLDKEMQVAAANQEYERAARLRDDIKALERAVEKQSVVLGDGTDADVIGLSEDPLEAAVQVFYVRGGRVRGQRGWVVDKVEDLTTGDLVEHFLQQVYGGESGEAVPREVLVPALPPDAEAVAAWLTGLRGSTVTLRVPRRGDKRALMETVERNAANGLALHKTKRGSDLTARSLALSEIQDALGLDDAPLRIECYDVSHLQESEVVASMVVFEDGLARKSEYRRFVIRGQAGRPTGGDVASIAEVIGRRFRRYVEERAETGEVGGIDPDTGKPRRFAYAPHLVVVDGGAPQVAAAQRALDELGVDDVALCGLAKRLEEVWLPGDPHPVVLPRTSEGLYLLQRVRDEAHRFAITLHRSRRSKSMTASALDGVPGLGETRRTALLKHFGSLKRLSAATVEEVTAVPGVGPRTAGAVVAALAAGRQASGTRPVAVNTATGEILDDDEQAPGTPAVAPEGGQE